MKRLIRTLIIGALGLGLAAPGVPAPAHAAGSPAPSRQSDDQTLAPPQGATGSGGDLAPAKRGKSGPPPAKTLKPPPREQTVRPQPPPRRPTEMHPGWPLKRPPRETILRRRRERDRVPPLIFLPPVLFGGILIDDRRDRRDPRHRYERDRLTWSDSETLYRDDEWVEFVLDCNARGEKLWIEVRDGRARIDWAEVVFADGEAQVVDFKERSLGPGLYRLLEFRDDRRVDHVRMVAQAATREVRLILRMER